MRLLLVLCCLSSCFLRAEDDWQTVLHQIALSVGDAVKKSNNYICEQDLSRFYYVDVEPAVACHEPPELPATPMRVQDRLKLDVAVSQGTEIYSWHGERKFSGGSVSEVVKDGPISSGSFSGYLQNIFGERGVHFAYRGRAKKDGVEVFQFDYDVPLASSHYQIQAQGGFELTAFHGSFTAQADTYALYSLTVTADGAHLTSKTSICAAGTSLTYQMVKIADHESPLPASFDLLVGSRNGVFTESKGVYTKCREYRGESTISFEDDKGGPVKKDAELQPEPLRAGVTFSVALQTEIDEDTAYAGLPVEAVLKHDIKINKQVKLLRGAVLHGTLTRFEIFHQPLHRVAIKVEFDRIIAGDKLYLCKAIHDASANLPQIYTLNGGRRGTTTTHVAARPGSEPNDGTEFFQVNHLHLSKNYSSDLITVASGS